MRDTLPHVLYHAMVRYGVVNKYGAPCVLKGGRRDTVDETDARTSASWWDAASPTHAPHRVEVVP